MPMVHVKAAPLYEYDGKGVWPVFKDNSHMKYWYTTDPYDDSGDAVGPAQFDVRNLPQYEEGKSHLEIISNAVLNGDLELTEEVFGENEVPLEVTMIFEHTEAEHDYLSSSEIRSSAQRAVRNALDHMRGEGFDHPLADEVSFFAFDVRSDLC